MKNRHTTPPDDPAQREARAAADRVAMRHAGEDDRLSEFIANMQRNDAEAVAILTREPDLTPLLAAEFILPSEPEFIAPAEPDLLPLFEPPDFSALLAEPDLTPLLESPDVTALLRSWDTPPPDEHE